MGVVTGFSSNSSSRSAAECRVTCRIASRRLDTCERHTERLNIQQSSHLMHLTCYIGASQMLLLLGFTQTNMTRPFNMQQSVVQYSHATFASYTCLPSVRRSRHAGTGQSGAQMARVEWACCQQQATSWTSSLHMTWCLTLETPTNM